MKRPKKLWIGFNSETKSYRVYEHDPHLAYAKPYHLHPGNEVKLKRGHAIMASILKRWVRCGLTLGDRWELERKLPDLFKTKRRGSK